MEAVTLHYGLHRRELLRVNRIPSRWVMTPSVPVPSRDRLPLGLENKPAVPVGRHAACRSVLEADQRQSSALVLRGQQQTLYSTDKKRKKKERAPALQDV